MPSSLENVSSNPTLREYAAGAAQNAIAPVADFLAPPVDVGTSVGKYKRYTEKNRFHIPDTVRGMEGRAVELRFDANDENYNCTPHAIDVPIDRLQELESAALENSLMEGATMAAEVGALSHEKAVISSALTAVGAGTNVDTSVAATELVDAIDGAIESVILASKMGSLMDIGVLMGATAYRRFKNHPTVRDRFRAGSARGKSSATIQTINPSLDDVSSLFLATPEVKVTYNVEDLNGPGEDENIAFLLGEAVLIFARKAAPTRRDPSFMKTFRLSGEWMVPGAYTRDDGRVDVAKFDWSEDVAVTNTQAAQRINFTTS